MKLALYSMLAIAAAAFSEPLYAGSASDVHFKPITAGTNIPIRSDKGLILIRIDTSVAGFSADIMRVPTDAELSEYDNAKRKAYSERKDKDVSFDDFPFQYKGNKNLFEFNPGRSLSKTGNLALVLAEVEPGDYIFYGQGSKGALNQCFCLGTVGFSVPAGRIVDLGTMLAGKGWEPAKFPELASESGLGKAARGLWSLHVFALRPRVSSDPLPQGIDARLIEAAKFKAIGPFLDPNSYTISRLAPIPGVLSYDGARVIDVATGQEALSN